MGRLEAKRPEKLTTAIFNLLRLKSPTMTFYRSTLMSLDIGEDNTNCPSMSTNGKMLWYNREWVEGKTVPQLMWTITHELSHVRLDHPYRMKKILEKLGYCTDMERFTKEDREAWRICNIAADCSINPVITESYLMESQMGERGTVQEPEGALTPKMFHLKKNGTMEQYTRMLLKMRRKKQEEEAKWKDKQDQYIADQKAKEEQEAREQYGIEQEGGSDGNPTESKPDTTLPDCGQNDTQGPPDTQAESERDKMDSQIPREAYTDTTGADNLEYAMEKADNTGQVEPDNTSNAEKNLADAEGITKEGREWAIFRMVKGELTAKMDWRVLLESKLTKDYADYSWSRQNKRTLDQDIQMPALYSERLPELIILIDVSSSIDEAVLKRFCGEVESILEATPKKVLIVTHNQDVVQHFEWQPGNQSFCYETLKIGGGTSHIDAFEKLPDLIGKYNIEPEVLVIFTDTCTHWPREIPDYFDPMIVVPEDETDIHPPPWPCPILRVTGNVGP